MNRRDALIGLGGLGLVSSFVSDNAQADDRKQHHHSHFDKCAKACGECMNACNSCFSHCSTLVADGKRDHVATMQLCNDCGDLCAVSARLCARNGPMALIACEACAKACDACAKQCEKYASDPHMKACAESCRTCAKACREMIAHASQG